MITRGQIVRSLRGRDKHRYYVVLQSDFDWVILADGKVRKLEHPKRKNRKHVEPTKHTVNLSEITSNKALRRQLEPLNLALRQGSIPQGR